MWKLSIILILLAGIKNICLGWGQLGYASNIVSQNSGDTARGISVSVSTVSASLIYSRSERHREILLQNTDSTYDVHCGTFSSVTADEGVPRWILPVKPSGFTTNGTYHIYCIADPSAGSNTIEIIGSMEYDSRD